MSKEIKVNLNKVLMEAIAGTEKSHKYIDEYFYSNQEKYATYIQENKDVWSKEYDIDSFLIKEKSYLYKLLAIFKDMIDTMTSEGLYTVDVDILIDLLQKTYPESYKYAVSCNILKLSNLAKKLKKRKEKLSDNEINGNLLTGILISNSIDRTDDFYNIFMNAIYTLHSSEHRELVETQCLYENETKEIKNLINKTELVLRSRYYKNGYNASSILYEAYRLGVSDPESKLITEEGLKKIKDKQTAKISLAMAFDLDATNYPRILEMLGDTVEIDIKDIKNAICSYFSVTNWSKEEDIDYNELHQYIDIMIINYVYLKAYNRADEFFFNNYSDKTNIELINVNKELRECKKKNLKLQDENSSLKNEIESLKKELELLKKENVNESYNRKELTELRNFVFNLESDESVEKFDDNTLEIIQSTSAISIGGNKAWCDKMKEVIPSWTFIPLDMINFDASILKSFDYVFIKATHISHAMYYKIIANINEEQKLRYINSNNIDKVVSEIKTAIM